METLQWTLLVGLLAMVVYVLWARLRASYARGVAPQVKVDWEGEAWWSPKRRWTCTCGSSKLVTFPCL